MSAVPLYDLDQQVLAACGQLRFSPLAIESAHGSSIVDSEERVLIDFSAGGSAAGLGCAQPAATATVQALYRAWELGVTAISVGPERNVIELTPPLIITDVELWEGFDRLGSALADVAAGKLDDQDLERFAGWG